jgi:hypothetical protein
MNRLLVVAGIAISLLESTRVMAGDSQRPDAKGQRTIPLSEVVTTGSQKGLQNIDEVIGEAEAYNEFMMRFRNVKDGSSNLLLVDAKELGHALNASSNVLFGSHPADKPAAEDKPKPKRGSHWLVAYLGSGPSNPTQWVVDSVSVEKGRIILNYHKAKTMSATKDMRRYFFWIPLGKLAPGNYELQLVDSENGAVTLMRRVEVAATGDGGETR